MSELLDNVYVRLAFWGASLAGVLAVAAYVIQKVRVHTVQEDAETLQGEPLASQLLSKYREMRSRGVLTEEEFRTIKTTLSASLQEELKDNGETG